MNKYYCVECQILYTPQPVEKDYEGLYFCCMNCLSYYVQRMLNKDETLEEIGGGGE